MFVPNSLKENASGNALSIVVVVHPPTNLVTPLHEKSHILHASTNTLIMNYNGIVVIIDSHMYFIVSTLTHIILNDVQAFSTSSNIRLGLPIISYAMFTCQFNIFYYQIRYHTN